ncbi:MAG: DUF3098 domain-containing protein [Muribaculaceae bacterium]|nr:DUF3098 domain-containing protein [Muribaculaceae bacterium]
MANNKNYKKKEKTQIQSNKFPLRKINFLLMGVCCAMIVLGFILISGEPSSAVFNPEIFSTRRIVVGPAICFLGFLLMPVALLWKGKKD